MYNKLTSVSLISAAIELLFLAKLQVRPGSDRFIRGAEDDCLTREF